MTSYIDRAKRALAALQTGDPTAEPYLGYGTREPWREMGRAGFEALVQLYHQENGLDRALILSQFYAFEDEDIDDEALLSICTAGVEDTNRTHRKLAAELLGTLSDERIVSPLLAAVRDIDGEVRDLAAQSIAYSWHMFNGAYEQQALSLLVAGLDDPHIGSRQSMAFALNHFVAPSTLQDLRRALASEEDDYSAALIAHTLALLGEEDLALTKLTTTLRSDDFQAQDRSIDGLADLGDRRALPHLINCFEAQAKLEEPPFLDDIVRAIGACGDNSARPFLLETLRTHRQCTAEVLQALAQCRDAADGELCLQHIQDSPRDTNDYCIIASAFSALGTMSGKATRVPLINYLSDEEETIRQLAIHALFRRNEAIGFQAILRHFEVEQSVDNRIDILELWRKHGMPHQGVLQNRILLEALHDPEEELCYEVLLSLGEWGYSSNMSSRLQDLAEGQAHRLAATAKWVKRVHD